MIDDTLLKGLKPEKMFQNVRMSRLDCGLYSFEIDGVTYLASKHIEVRHRFIPQTRPVGVYYNIEAALRPLNRDTFTDYFKPII